jgi:N-acyl-D-amino-acid deacylase
MRPTLLVVATLLALLSLEATQALTPQKKNAPKKPSAPSKLTPSPKKISPPTKSSQPLTQPKTKPPTPTSTPPEPAPPTPTPPDNKIDLLIKNASVIDGSGSPPTQADIAIKDGKILAVGTITDPAADTIDAENLTVTPGFIDVHTHAEKEVKGAVGGDDILSIPDAENFVRMGVTTIVTGNCGLSSSNIQAFLDAVDQTRPAINVATLAGHNTLREKAMGGILRRPPTPEEQERMRALLAEALRSGALGLSTGLIYVPGSFSDTEELVDLAKTAAAHGGIYASHMRYETSRIFEAIEEVIRIAKEADIPAQISHLKLSGPAAWGRAKDVLAKLDSARNQGLQISHDCYAYTYSSTGLAQLLPDASREGGRDAFRQRISNPEQREAILQEMANMRERLGRKDYTYAIIAKYDADPSLQGKTIPEAAQAKLGSDSLENQTQLLLDIEANGGGSGVFQNMNDSDMSAFLSHRMTMIASDGSPRRLGEAMPHPRSFGNNARVLAKFVRDNGTFLLEEAVRKMTSLPAETFKIPERGRIQAGAIADLAIFNPNAVADRSEVGDPHHLSEGFHSVLVSGIPILRDGKMTGQRPGRSIRLKKNNPTPEQP